MSQVFTFNTTLSIIINFVGGLYFIYLVLMNESKISVYGDTSCYTMIYAGFGFTPKLNSLRMV